MDLKLFGTIFTVGIILVLIQGFASWFDGYLTQDQMVSRGIIGWSFMEHGGMWADVLVISPFVAYLVSRYQFPYVSNRGIMLLAIAIALSLIMGHMYQKGGMLIPEAHTHHGTTTIAGWIHGVFAVAAIWIFAMVYLPGMATPPVSKVDLLVISIMLTPFFYLGVAKFNPRWTFSVTAKLQVLAEIILIWVVAALRII